MVMLVDIWCHYLKKLLEKTKSQLLADICVKLEEEQIELMMDDIATGAYKGYKKATWYWATLIKVMMSSLYLVNYEANDYGYVINSELSNETSREIDWR